MLDLKRVMNCFRGMAVFAVMPLSLTVAMASTVVPDTHFELPQITKSTPNHAIFLKCKADLRSVYLSKGVVLDSPNELKARNRDFAIVTGHGLEEGAECYVSDFQGNSHKVLSTTFASDYKSGTDTDWAVISFKKIKGPHIVRYPVEEYLSGLSSLNNKNVSFAQARGLPQNNQKCQLAVMNVKSINNISPFIGHNCRAIGGQSGSPITSYESGQHKLIGLHLGNSWTLKSPITGKPGKINFLRPYDQDMYLEVRKMLRELKEQN